MKKIATVIPTIFDDFLIISLSKKWIDVWKEIPKFSVGINSKGNLVIESILPVPNFRKKKVAN